MINVKTNYDFAKEQIETIDYVILPDRRTTICQAVLKNGFSVIGQSTCMEKLSFNKELGEMYALENACVKIIELQAYALANVLSKNGTGNIARVCHEVNRAYCLAIGDKSQPAWDDAPDWQKLSAYEGVKFHLAANWAASASHENWMKHKLADGWVYGPEKNADKKTHPCLVPFSELPKEQRIKDYLFKAVVDALKISR